MSSCTWIDGSLRCSVPQHSFHLDEDTVAFFGVVRWCLVRYFGHSDASAGGAVDSFLGKLDGPDSVEWLHHDGPWWTALRVHHLEDLGGEWDDFHEWRVANGYRAVPEEVHEYFRAHYLKP